MLALAGAVAPVTAQHASAIAEAAPFERAPRPTIVLESYVGRRPDDADAILAPLLDELDARGFAAHPASVVARIGGLAPRPGALDPDRTAAEVTQPADPGFVAYTRGRFAEAEALLSQALDQIHRNPALLVLDTDNLNTTFKVLVALALSQAKRGETGQSIATMVELIRTFRSQPITRADYGPDAEQLYRAVVRQVQAMGRGQLAITVDSDQAVIFVDGQIRGLGKAALADLVPGIYRVFVQVPPSVGRQYEIEVTADELAELHVDWEADSTLVLTDRWVGLGFATEAEHARQALIAGRLARRWRRRIAVVGVASSGGGRRRRVTARLYDPAGAAVRGAAVGLDGPDADPADDRKLRALAQYLADGTVEDGVERVPGPEAAAALASPRSRWLPGLLVGTGAAAVLAGGVLYAIDQDGAQMSGMPGQMPGVDRNTAPAGLAIGAAGLAAVGIGLWMWRTRGRSSAPVVAIGCCGGFFGWAGEL
jgi:hypothetical protein